ncbi:putative G-protein coupled receptor 160 [Triplophysa rosa]|uniref:G-protein coupled receptor 160 n=1 Tax=Triplophysa rosa TaxID=992332 RepID=A0A9W7WXH5_TRIRA|nr:putative G-protein coupled receptor 160 [Triplophysa rosa]
MSSGRPNLAGAHRALGLCLIMDTLFPSLLLSLWLKSFVNWVVVTVQRHHVIRSFSGFFCVSLALVDSFFSFTITAIYYLEDFNISGWRVTRYHACLLPQIACLVCGVLHWPVFLLGVLDHFWTPSPIASHVSRVQKLVYATAACLLWILATCYVFWVPDVVLLGDDRNRCDLFSSSQSVQVLGVLLLTVTCVILYSFTPCVKPRGQVFQHSTRGTQQSCFLVSRPIMYTFLNTWASYIILMLVLLFLQMELNAYLEMNSVWLCFLNSFSVAMALCGRSFAFDSKNSQTVTDGFCSWSFCFIYGTENADKGPIHVLDGRKLDSQDGGKCHIFLH